MNHLQPKHEPPVVEFLGPEVPLAQDYTNAGHTEPGEAGVGGAEGREKDLHRERHERARKTRKG
jgi:hypothetical protein